MAKFVLYTDRVGEYRWKLVSENNGNTTADGAEGYTSEQGARAGIDFVKTNAASARIEDLTTKRSW